MLRQDIQENPDNKELLHQIYYLDYVKIPSYFYNSSIVSLYSLLENSLNNLCDKIQSETNLVIRLNDLAGSNIIQKARKFLAKFANVDFSVVDKEWLRIVDFQKLRNLIVHQNAQLKNPDLNDNETEDYKILKRFESIDIDNSNRIFYITDGKILIEFLSLIENFMSDVSSQISKRSFKIFEIVDKPIDLPF